MATSNNGVAITPERAGYGGRKAISLSDTPIKLAFALAATTKAREGVTLDEFVVRTMAAGLPLWWRPVKVGELTWFVRQPGTPAGQRRGTTHVCSHRAKKGSIETCAGGHTGKGETCGFEFRSAGDGVRRWRNDVGAHEPPAFDGDANATVKAARDAMRGHLANLAARKFSRADMLATPSIADAIERGMATDAMLPGGARKARKRGKAADNATEPAAVAHESVAPTAVHESSDAS